MTGVRIATFNVLFGHHDEVWGSWSARLPLIGRAIELASPDVIGLQEALPSKLSTLAPGLTELGLTLVPGPPSGPLRDFDFSLPYELVRRLLHAPRTVRVAFRTTLVSERTHTGEHAAIAYRGDRFDLVNAGAFWISDRPLQPGSMLRWARTPFLVHHVRLRPRRGGRDVFVFNGHLGHAPWHHRATARVLRREISAVAAGTDAAVFLVGDFNALRSSALLRTLTGPAGGFADAAATAPERVGPEGTFHWGRGARRLRATIDYVLARNAPSPRRAETIDVHEGPLFPSDHYPLVVEFEPERHS